MARKTAIALALIMLAVVAWGIFYEAGSTRVIINGEELAWPLEGTIGAAGFVVALTALFCAAILLLFVFAGAGILALGAVIVLGLVVATIAFPLILLLLLPLAIVWAFIAIMRSAGT